MMINPVPPDPSNFLDRISTSEIYQSSAVTRNHYLKHHYMLDVPDSTFRRYAQPHFNQLALEPKLPQYISKLLPSTSIKPRVRLEPRSAPMLVVYTDCDRHDDKTRSAVDSFFELDQSEVVTLGVKNRAPMVDKSDIILLHRETYSWISSLSY